MKSVAVFVAVTVATAAALFMLAGLLSLGGWQIGAIPVAIALLGSVFLWRSQSAASGRRSRAVPLGIAVAAVGIAALFFPWWRIQAEHDERLATFSRRLCTTRLPEGASVEGCGGSITNTGNGNSCEYTAWAIVSAGTAGQTAVRDSFAAAAPYPPAHEGAAVPVDGPTFEELGSEEVSEALKVTIVSGWTPEEDDPRCQ